MMTLELIYENGVQICVTDMVDFKRDPYYILVEFEKSKVSGYTTKDLSQFNVYEFGESE